MVCNEIICGHVLDVLKSLPSDLVDCIITSPPYFGLRFYGTEANAVWGGDDSCIHTWGEEIKTQVSGGQFCTKCNAWLGQLGLEPTLELYIQHLLAITAELKRVLKPTGTLWWIHGDSYNTNQASREKIPPKTLFLQNYIVAQKMIYEQGWVLRNVVIWKKPNAKPSSVKDRFTVDYEPIFFFSKQEKYYFKQQFEPYSESSLPAVGKKMPKIGGNKYVSSQAVLNATYTGNRSEFKPSGRNKRCVWEIPTQHFSAKSLGFENIDHFAVFPLDLVKLILQAGCPPKVCKTCGQPEGFCKHEDGFNPGLVLDPFIGSGTTAIAALSLGLNFIGIEINPNFVELAKRRIKVFQQTTQETLFNNK